MTPQVRIGDAERERAQAALAEHYAAGRLDHDEYSDRLDRIWEARTQADLAPVFADLPRPAQGRQDGPPRVATGRTRPRLPWPLLVLLVVLASVVVATNLPLIVIGLGVWFFFVRGGCRPHRRW